MQKALKWLDARGVAYAFHNYKEQGIDKATLEVWLKHFETNKLVNMRSTTYRELTEEEKASISSKPKAIKLMIKYNSIIKRPVWDFGDGRFYLGWNEAELKKMV